MTLAVQSSRVAGLLWIEISSGWYKDDNGVVESRRTLVD